MNTRIKTLLVIAGLLSAGTLLAYGPGGNGPGGYYGPGGYGSGYGAPMMGHMMGSGPMGYANGYPGGNDTEDTATRLQRIHAGLGITPTQEAAWSRYANALTAHWNVVRDLHSGDTSAFGNGADGRPQSPPQAMWESRSKLQNATQALFEQLSPEQQQRAGSVLGFGHHM